MSSLAELADAPLDLLVVGGGVTGCGAALDAASRGLRVGLVEQGDLGSGTSSRSSRLVHGGLRYLEQFQFGLVREALRERRLLLERIAPHLVRPVPFLCPLTRPAWERAYMGAGLALYDALAGASGVPRHRHLGRASTLAQAPALHPGRVTGAIRYFDAQVDDARLTVALARTAERHGALIVPGARVDAVRTEGDRPLVEVADAETGEQVRLRPRRVLFAVGPWTGLAGERFGLSGGLRVAMSKGVHLVVDRSAIETSTAVIGRTPNSVLFLIPWGDRVIVGTTDTPWPAAPGEVAATSADVDYLIGQANRLLARPIGRADVISTYAGVRPLVSAKSAGSTASISREHVVVRQAPGVFAVAGGKLTTYRVMAADAVDAAFQGEEIAPSQTHRLPLLGAAWYAATRAGAERLAERSGLDSAAIGRLLRRYGDETEDLLDQARAVPGLLEPLAGAPRHLRAEVVWAARHEKARHLADVLVRRLRVATETPDRGETAAADAAALMAAELGWSGERVSAEVDDYLRQVRAEREALAVSDDREAASLMADLSRQAVRESGHE
ncbi:glycerol-3-phosphate dehydrogenase/oxidase [Microtetraspora malaysiensis]|uniref:glycerol-3-phosphate dehydrogenase/oxidase n=1 Tax=Microtetraspora malaysiensis TaxID=161358 RepID=UPI000829CC1D|nr:glycerol-3-phosphate dehydrogenase/oxidase [Microtetraspora malaysiensis]